MYLVHKQFVFGDSKFLLKMIEYRHINGDNSVINVSIFLLSQI